MSERAARATPAEPAEPVEPPAVPEPAKLMRVLALAGALSRAPAREALLERILDEAIALTGAERGFVILEPVAEAPRDDPAALRVQVARNLDGEKLGEAYRKFSRGIVARVLAEERALLLGEAGDDARFGERRSVRELKLRSVLCAPLRVEGRTRGVLYLDNRFRRAAFSAADAVLLEFLATQAGGAIETQWARERHETTILAFARDREQQAARLEALWEDYQAARLAAPAPALRAPDPSGLVGASPAMDRLRAALARVAASEEPALILGESGTGKELVARALHAGGRRRARRFVPLNCAAVPEALLESELFGHRRGSWTGATADREGLFRAASGGTLFLDEVGETSPAMQAKLLRVLQEGEVRPLGGERSVKVDVRVVAATNRDLESAVAEGSFRQDLYYRLAVLTLRVPPLRERAGDVERLAEHVLARCAERAGPPTALSDGARRALASHRWPGNVRELENAVKRAHALAAGRALLTAKDFADLARAAPTAARTGRLPLPAPYASGPADPLPTLEEQERLAIVRALGACDGNVRAAADRLGIHRATLYRKLDKYGLR